MPKQFKQPRQRVSATLTPAQRDAILADIAALKQKMAFLINLDPADKRSMPKMGDDSRGFVSRARDLVRRDDSFLPRAFDVAEMERDVTLAEMLQPIQAALNGLSEAVDDTYTEVGSEAYVAALIVYQSARANGVSSALDEALDDLSARFARKTSGGGADEKPAAPAP